MRISGCSSDVCSSDLGGGVGVRQGVPRPDRHRSCTFVDVRNRHQPQARGRVAGRHDHRQVDRGDGRGAEVPGRGQLMDDADQRSEEHTSELQSLMRISYAVFCLKKKTKQINYHAVKSISTNIRTIYTNYTK